MVKHSQTLQCLYNILKKDIPEDFQHFEHQMFLQSDNIIIDEHD